MEGGAVGGEESGADDRAPVRRGARLVGAGAALVALPALAAGSAALGADWVPASDFGPLEVRVRDVFSSHPPLVGPFARFDGNHPGPAIYYALALPYRLLGSNPWALLVGAAGINAVALALAVRIAGRGGRVVPAALLAALGLACVATLGPDHLRDPWNPHLALFPFLLACLATWAVACGSRRSLPVAVAAASFSVQCHAGYVVLVGVLGLWWLAGPILDRHHLRDWVRPAALAALVAALMWAPPVVEQLVGDGGNLGVILSGAEVDGEPRLGFEGAGRYLLPHLGPTPAWFVADGSDPFALGGRVGLPMPPLGAVAGVATVAVALVRRRRDELVLVGLTVTSWAAGTISVALITGLALPYVYLWIRVLDILLWWSAAVVLGRAVGDALRDRGPAALRRALPLVAVGSVACGALVVAVDAGRPAFRAHGESYAGAGTLAREVGGAVDGRPGPAGVVDLRWSGPLAFVVPAVVAELERGGHHVLVEPGSRSGWGPGRAVGDTLPDLAVVIGTDPDLGPPGGELIASVPDQVPEGRTAYAWLVDVGT